MPDLSTHLAVAYGVRQPFPALARYGPVFYLGAVLPDVLTRAVYILWPQAFWLVAPLHTPVGLVLVCWLAALLFEEVWRKGAFLSLLAGVGMHFGLDLLQRHVVSAYFPFFPLSWVSPGGGLFWPDDSLYALPFLLAGIAAWELVRRRKQGVR